VTRFVFLRNTHQEESHIASQTGGASRRASPSSIGGPTNDYQPPTNAPISPSFVPLQLEPNTRLPCSRGRQARRAASCTLEFPNGVLVHFSGDIDAQLLTCLLRAAGDKS